jgi:hypothetical protein
MDGMNTSWPLSLVRFCIVLDPGAQILQLLESVETSSAEIFFSFRNLHFQEDEEHVLSLLV